MSHSSRLAAPPLRPRPSRARGALLALLVSLAAPAALAQTGTLRGQVVDAGTGAPLIGATVAVPGTGLGAATDVGGAYALDLPAGAYTVRVSYTGYVPVDRDVSVRQGTPTTLNVGLEPDVTGIEEVVVTGALSERSVSRSEVAVSRIDAEALTEVTPYQDLSQLLNGKVAGVSVQPSSGNVGSGVRFNVRAGGGLNGDGQPLIFIDGVRVNNTEIEGFDIGGQGVGALSDLNPDDIASIDVLKGPAAAALYGTDASNGVVLITTKRGSYGGTGAVPFTVDYSVTLGENRQQTAYDSTTVALTADDANAVFRDGPIRQHTLAVAGGSNAVRYFAQVDTRDEDGIVFGNGQDRTSLRGNFEAFPLPNLSLGVNTSYGFNTVTATEGDNSVLGYITNTVLSPTPYSFSDSAAVRDLSVGYQTNRFLGSANLRYTPVPSLTLQATVGLDASDTRGDELRPSNLVYTGVVNGQRAVYTRENDQISFQADGRYRYRVGRRLLLATAVGVQGFDRRIRTGFFEIQDFATPLITDYGAGAEFQEAGEFFNNVRQVGLIAEQSAEYDDTVFGSVGLRNDYASTIGVDAPSIVYPTARLAVRLDRFGAVPAALSLLKLRAAYGESGQLPGSFDGVPVLYSAEVGGDGAGAVPQSIGNAAIQPERVGEFEAGLDIELLGRAALQATYYRQVSRESIFDAPLPPSSGLVASNRPTNVGRIVGEGLELALNGTALASRAATLDLGVILNYATNRVESIGTTPNGDPLAPLFDGFDVNVIRAGVCAYSDADGYRPNLGPGDCPTEITGGLPRSAFYTEPVNGALFDDDGAYAGVDAGINDLNLDDYRDRLASGECEYDPTSGDSRCLAGTPYPSYNGSVSATLTLFGDLTVYALADWATDLRVYNSTRQFQVLFGNDLRRIQLRDQLGLGDRDVLPDLQPDTDAYREAADAYARTSGSFDANFIEDADFLKLREVTVRYNVGRLLAQAAGLDRVRTASVALSARNLWTTTRYSGVDPEVNYAGARSLSRGQDFLTLQTPRVVYLTVQLGI